MMYAAPHYLMLALTPLPTLGSAFAAAVADARKLDAVQRLTARYLWLPPRIADRALYTRILKGHLNHRSTEADFGPLVAVPETLGQLLRIDLEDYGVNWPKVWEKLADSDPYGHATLEKV